MQMTVIGAVLVILGLVVLGLVAVGYLVGIAIDFLGVILILGGVVAFQRAMKKKPVTP